jgi:DNA-binding LacI/PurR family transcriptional regulator
MTELRKRVTALDVAHAAGVSKTTVSYVLNQTPNQSIPAETRRRVLDAVRDLNYTPLSAARALRRGHNDTVLLVMPDWPLGRTLALVLDALAVELESQGLSLLIRRQHHGQSLSGMWRELAPAAVIALGEVEESEEEAILAAGIFAATALLTSPSSPRTAVVVPQDAIGALQVRHLAARGHRQLAFAGPGDPRFAAFRNLRLDGARRACEELGLPDPEALDVDPSLEGAIAAARHWLERAPRVTAVVAYNDEFAAALVAGLHQLGRSAPGDLAIIGVDNEPLARFISPSLTTVDQNHELVAAHLAQLVVNGLAGEPAPHPLHSDALTLVVREST